MIKLIVIIGPTASSKSNLAMKLAAIFNSEIISCDAFQVYKELNAGINKPSIQELKQVKHHFINCISIYDQFNISIFQNQAIEIIKQLNQESKSIILCGGSNLYIDALIKGYQLSDICSRDQITYFDNWQYEDIYNYVLLNDPTEAHKIHKNNKQRIIRAAQIIYATDNLKSKIQNKTYQFDCFIINVQKNREELYQKINNRVDSMYANNWYQEVLDLYNIDNSISNLQAFKAIGYQQILNAIINNTEVDLAKIKQLTRNYAKRQITWNNNKYENVFNYENNFDTLLTSLKKWYQK